MSDLLLGIDIGTTNIKAVLATANGRVVAQAQRGYPIYRPHPNHVEQDPEDWWQGTIAVTREVMGMATAVPEQIIGIGISGQGCAVTLIDYAGQVVRPAIIWMDSRAEPQSAALRQTCAALMLERNGKQPAPYNADPVLMWLQQHEPTSIAAAQCSLTTTGYINFRLTGEPVTNISDASILFAFDLVKDDWSDELINAFNLPRKLYPRIAPCHEIIGGLTSMAARELGLRPGTPVIAGGEDTSSAGLSIGAGRPGQAFLSLGTAGTMYAVGESLTIHPQLLAFRHVVPHTYLLGGSMAAVGGALSWCRDLLGGNADFGTLTALAAQSNPGADGLIFLPYLSGELQPINDGHARGVFFGLRMHTGQPQLIRAVMEGAAYAIAHNVKIAAQVGATINEIRAVGGPTRSPLWCQIMADVIGRPISVMVDNAGAPLGNALLTAVGLGLIDDPVAVANQEAYVGHIYTPHPDRQAQYAPLFAIYQRLYPLLREEFAALAGIGTGNQELRIGETLCD
jgi:xylulokinase